MTTRSLERLRRLVDIRRRQEERSRNTLAQSLRQASAISEEVRARSNALEAVMRGNDPVRRRQAEPLVDASTVAIAAAKAAESAAYGTLEEIRGEWESTARRLQGAERLEERATEDALVEQLRHDRIAVDEAITSRLPGSDKT